MTLDWVAQGLNVTTKPSRDPVDFPDPFQCLTVVRVIFFVSMAPPLHTCCAPWPGSPRPFP